MAGGRTLTLKVQTEIKGLEQLDKIGVKVSKFGRDLTTHLTLPLLAAGGAAFKFASDIQESSNKAAQVFGESIDKIDRHATSLEDILDEATFRDVAGTFGALLQNMGLTADASADLSVRWIQLGQDMASFHNVDPTEALNAIRSALSGEFEPLKRFGVFLNEATIKQRALEQGLWDGTGAIDANTRAVIVNQELFRQQASVLGDVERTMDDAANSTRNLWANFKDTAGSLVEDFLPAATGLLKMVNGWVVGFKSLSPATKTLIVQIAGVVAVTGPLLFVFGKVLTSIKLFVGAAKLIRSAWLNIPTLLGFVDLALSKIGPAFSAAATAARTFASLALGPLGIAVAAFTAGFATDFLGMRTRFEKDMADIGDFLGDAGDNFRDFFGIVEEMGETEKAGWAAYQERIDSTITAAANIVETGVDAMAAEVGEAPGKMADELLAAQFHLTDASTQLVNFMAEALSPMQEKAEAQAFLASDALAMALGSPNPLVRQKAAELAQQATDVLNNTSSFYEGGRKAGLAWSAGLRSAYGASYSAGVVLASGAGLSLRGLSPPKEGPLKDIDIGGFNIGKAWAEGLGRAVSVTGKEAYGLAGAAAAAMGRAIGFGGISGMATLRPAAVGAGMGGGTTINNNFYLQWDGEAPKGRSEQEIIANLQRLSPLIGGKLAAGY